MDQPSRLKVAHALLDADLDVKSLLSWVARLLVAENPGVGFIESQLHERDVVSVKACRFVPDVALLKKADNGNGVADAGACAFPPDTDPNQAFAEFMYW